MFRIPTMVLIFLILNGCATSEKVQYENVDQDPKKVDALLSSYTKCSDELKKIYSIKDLPPLKLVFYGNIDSFIAGVVGLYGYSKKNANRYLHGGSPKPNKGLYLIPPKTNNQNLCHEIVHYTAELVTPIEKISQIKWFDEGQAQYFSGIIFNYDFSQDKKFLEKNKLKLIPYNKLITPNDWGLVFNNVETRKIAYVQVQSMFYYFMSKYQVSYFKILQGLNHKTFDEVFVENIHITPDSFYNEWLAENFKN